MLVPVALAGAAGCRVAQGTAIACEKDGVEHGGGTPHAEEKTERETEDRGDGEAGHSPRISVDRTAVESVCRIACERGGGFGCAGWQGEWTWQMWVRQV